LQFKLRFEKVADTLHKYLYLDYKYLKSSKLYAAIGKIYFMISHEN